MNLYLYALWALLFVYIIMRVTAAIRTEPDSIDDRNPYLHPGVKTVPDPELQHEHGDENGENERKTDNEYETRDESKTGNERKTGNARETEDERETIDKLEAVADGVGDKKGSGKMMAVRAGSYEMVWKRALDQFLAFLGLLLLSPVFFAIVVWIKIDDPGPAFFTQKRVGQSKHFFRLHKFRSMKMSTPHDVPTHMLENPEQYITKVGMFLRRSSLDEIPQIWDIFRGKMSIIGPRPALWNQDDLVAEREKYGANEPKPGLTGWAQINGRDELEIPVKARLDGYYTERLREGGLKAFLFDLKCFVGTIFSVAKAEGIEEAGTGEIGRKTQSKEKNGIREDSKRDQS